MEDNKYHPNQGMADAMTLWEHLGTDLRGRKLAVSWAYSPSTKNRSLRITTSCTRPATSAPTSSSPIRRSCASTRTSRPAIKANVELNGGILRGRGQYGGRLRGSRRRLCQELRLPRPAAAGHRGAQHDEMAKLFNKYRGWIADEQRMRLPRSPPSTCTASLRARLRGRGRGPRRPASGGRPATTRPRTACTRRKA